MKKITKKRQEDFTKEALAIAIEFGAIECEKYEFLGYELKVPTKYGRVLYINIREDQSYCFTIFMRFGDSPTENMKSELAGINPFTGKWNIHSNLEAGAIASLRYALGQVAK